MGTKRVRFGAALTAVFALVQVAVLPVDSAVLAAGPPQFIVGTPNDLTSGEAAFSFAAFFPES